MPGGRLEQLPAQPARAGSSASPAGRSARFRWPTNVAWTVSRDRGFTYAASPGRRQRACRREAGGRPTIPGPPLVSIDEEIAKGYGVGRRRHADLQRARPQPGGADRQHPPRGRLERRPARLPVHRQPERARRQRRIPSWPRSTSPAAGEAAAARPTRHPPAQRDADLAARARGAGRPRCWARSSWRSTSSPGVTLGGGILALAGGDRGRARSGSATRP